MIHSLTGGTGDRRDTLSGGWNLDAGSSGISDPWTCPKQYQGKMIRPEMSHTVLVGFIV
jgi:hypothetical protein